MSEPSQSQTHSSQKAQQSGRINLQPSSNSPELSDSHLRRERKHADQTIRRERSRADRASNRNKLREQDADVQTEREAADFNLAQDRKETDTGVELSERLLSDELAAHEKTRVELTSRDEFLAIVSHDLKNPIGTISAAAQMILSGATPSEVTQYTEMIKRNADAALRLISDLLDMERISAGKFELQATEHPLQKIIAETVKSFRHSALSKSILIEYQDPKEILVHCDADRVAQLLSNLLNNAIKFTPEGGRIGVTALIRDSEVQVSVTDTGPGIPDGKKERIFDRFSQLHKFDRRGLGLGLHICREIVNAHHGRLWVESQPGKGSTFTFTLPYAAERHYRSELLLIE